MILKFILEDKIVNIIKLLFIIILIIVIYQSNTYAGNLFRQITPDEFAACGYDNEKEFIGNLSVCLQIRDKIFKSGICSDINCLISRPEYIEENCDKNYDAFYYLVLISNKKQEKKSNYAKKTFLKEHSNKPISSKFERLNDYDKGFIAFDEEDYDTAYALLKNYGFTVVKPLLGYMYLFGLGTEQNLEKAAGLYLEVAKEGSNDAREIAAILYGKDYITEGKNEVIKSQNLNVIDKKDIFSQKKIIDIGYEKGINAFEDGRYKTAFKILKNYNINDLTEENPMMGLLTMFGYNSEKNIVKGFELFQDATREGDGDAQVIIALTYLNGEGDLFPRDFYEARKWFLEAAENGNAYAQKKLGDMYVLGLGVKPDIDTARNWYSKASENGDVIAKKYLGILDTDGLQSCARVLTADFYVDHK